MNQPNKFGFVYVRNQINLAGFFIIMKIFNNKEVFPLGTCITSKKSHFDNKADRRYNIVDIYRTYNCSRELIDIKYKLSSGNGGIIEAVRHINLLKHWKIEQQDKKNKKV